MPSETHKSIQGHLKLNHHPNNIYDHKKLHNMKVSNEIQK